MQDHELYRRILGIEAPWQVERVELKLQQGEVHVYLVHQNKLEWACAECGALGPLYDHQPEREWRHLDTCQYRTILHVAPPRMHTARGFRNKQNFINAIYSHCGGLDLAPSSTK